MCEYAGICVRAGKHSAPKSRYHHWKHEFHSQVIRVFSGVRPGRAAVNWFLSEAEIVLPSFAPWMMGSVVVGKASETQEAAPQRADGWKGRSCVFCPGMKPRPE